MRTVYDNILLFLLYTSLNNQKEAERNVRAQIMNVTLTRRLCHHNVTVSKRCRSIRLAGSMLIVTKQDEIWPSLGAAEKTKQRTEAKKK